MPSKAQGRIISFKADSINDKALKRTLNFKALQRYFYARHADDYLFTPEYSMAHLQNVFAGLDCEIIDITARQSSPYASIKKTLGSFSDALMHKSALPHDFLYKYGHSGYLFRAFINNYFSLEPGSRYLEFGAHDGSAFAAALYGNKLNALAVDDWKNKKEVSLDFLNTLFCINSPASRFGVIDKAPEYVSPESIAPQHAMFCQGGAVCGIPFLNEVLEASNIRPALLVIDSWNFAPYRQCWMANIAKSRYDIALSIEIKTSLDGNLLNEKSKPLWGEGYFIGLLTSKQS